MGRKTYREVIYEGTDVLTNSLIIRGSEYSGEDVVGVTLYVFCDIGSSENVTIAIKGLETSGGTPCFFPQETPESSKVKVLGAVQEYDEDGTDFNQMFDFVFAHRVKFWSVYVKDSNGSDGVITKIVAIIEKEQTVSPY
ncbi:hypothetical protein KAR91_79765 [Candidatus Pacearchaeota archaeon]|nr:hypothetical protein [Candidatus Pacearchaeota archaeon]